MSDDQLANLILAAATGIPAVVLLCVLVFGSGALLFLLFAWIIQPDRIAILKKPHDYGVDCWCGIGHNRVDAGRVPTGPPGQVLRLSSRAGEPGAASG